MVPSRSVAMSRGVTPPPYGWGVAKPLPELADIPVTRLKGVGEQKAKGLAELGITSVLDLLMHYPRRYLDRTNEASIRDLAVGEEGMVLATVKRTEARRTRQKRVMVQVDVTDGSGYLRCTFFNQPWREKQLKPGTQAVYFGKVDLFQGRKQMTNPVVDLIGDRTGRIVPVYPQSEKAQLTTWELGGWVEEALRRAHETRPSGASTCRRRPTSTGSPAAGWCSTSCSASSSSSSAASARSSGPRWASPTTSAVPWWPGSTSGSRSR
jgi:RecG-like helicase